jgi:ABC-type Mn2+/Zn2+ transport system permease subunit
MDDFLLLLQFMWIPITVTLLFSASLPILGTVLAVRNELLAAITLPMLSGAVLAVLAALGIPEDQLQIRVIVTVLTVSLIYWSVMRVITSQTVRQTVLAALWISSEGLTRLLVAAKPAIAGEFDQLLRGEMLAVGTGELVATAVVSLLFITVCIVAYPRLRSYLLDERTLKRFPGLFVQTDLTMKLCTTTLIVLATVTAGPLVTSSLMILPALAADNRRKGLTPTLFQAVALGITASLIGFPVSLMQDLPPAYAVSSALVLMVGLISVLRLAKPAT